MKRYRIVNPESKHLSNKRVMLWNDYVSRGKAVAKMKVGKYVKVLKEFKGYYYLRYWFRKGYVSKGFVEVCNGK